MQQQRFERKYFITARQAALVREFVRCHLEPDEFSVGRPDYAYPVHSLYLDSDRLLTYWATVRCEKNRFKLRVRFYDDRPESPVFFEIKRRIGECVLKRRGAVFRAAAPGLLAGELPERSHLVSSKPTHLAALQTFCQLIHQLDARPKVHVAYDREAWVSPGTNAVRVTLDRHVRGEECREARFRTTLRNPVLAFGDQWVLELKFTNRFPDWLGDLVRHFDLIQGSAAKYCCSVDGVGEDHLILVGAAPGAPVPAALMRYL